MADNKRGLILISLAVFIAVTIFYTAGSQDEEVARCKSATAADSKVNRSYPAWMDEVITPPPTVDERRIYTFTCELPMRKPDVFTTACADFGEMVREIAWEEWSIEKPMGNGIYSLNDCRPNCAEGTRSEIPVRVWLEDVTSDGKNYFFNTLKIVPLEAFEGSMEYAKNPSFWLYNDVELDGKTYQGATWDVSRDWKEFPEMRGELP